MADEGEVQIAVGADVKPAQSSVDQLVSKLETAIKAAQQLQQSLSIKPEVDVGFIDRLKDAGNRAELTFRTAAQNGAAAARKAFERELADLKVQTPEDRSARTTKVVADQQISQIDAQLDNVVARIVDHFIKSIERQFRTGVDAVTARLNQTTTRVLTQVGLYGGRSPESLVQEAETAAALGRQRQANALTRAAPIIGLSTEDIRARDQRSVQEQAERDNLAIDLRRNRQQTRAESENEVRDRLAGRTQVKAELENEVLERRKLNSQIRAELENELRDRKRARTITIAEGENARQGARPSIGDQARDTNERTLARLDLNNGASFLAVQARILANYVAISAAYKAFTGTVQGVIELEAELKQFQAITQTTNTEMVGFEQRLLSVAKSSKFTAVEVASAATILGQAGLSAKQVAETIQPVIQLATASGSTLKESVDVVTSVLSVFDLTAGEAGRVANVLTAGLNLSKLTIDKLGLGLQYAGNVAHDAGLSFTDLTAVLGGLANAGIRNGSTLGTGVRQVLLDLENPSKKFKEVMSELGITLADIDVKSNGLVGVLENLQKKGFTNSDAFRSFETRAVAAFAAISANLSTIRSFEGQMLLTNAAVVASDKQMESLTNTFNRFVSTLSTTTYTAGKSTINMFQGILQGATAVLEQLNNFPRALGYIIAEISTLAALGMAAKFIAWGASTKFVTEAIAGAVSGLGALRAAGTAIVATVNTIGLSAGVAALATTGLAAAFRGLLSFATANPLIAAFTAITTGYSIFRYFNDIPSELDKVNAKLNESKGRYDQTKTTIQSLNETIEKLGLRQEQLVQDPAALRNSILEAREAFSKFGLQLDANVNSVDGLLSALRRLRESQQALLPAELGSQLRSQQKKLDLEKEDLGSQSTFRRLRGDFSSVFGALPSRELAVTRTNDLLGQAGPDFLKLFRNPEQGSLESLSQVYGAGRSRQNDLQKQLNEGGPDSAGIKKKIEQIEAALALLDTLRGRYEAIKGSDLAVKDTKFRQKVSDIENTGPEEGGDLNGFNNLRILIEQQKQLQHQNLKDLLETGPNDSSGYKVFLDAQREAALQAHNINQQLDQFKLRLKNRGGFSDDEIKAAVQPLENGVAEVRSLFVGSTADSAKIFVEAQKKVLSAAITRGEHELSEIDKRGSQARTVPELGSISSEYQSKIDDLEKKRRELIEVSTEKDFTEQKQEIDELTHRVASDRARAQETFAARNKTLLTNALDRLVQQIETEIKTIDKQIQEIGERIRTRKLTGSELDNSNQQVQQLRQQRDQKELDLSGARTQRSDLQQTSATLVNAGIGPSFIEAIKKFEGFSAGPYEDFKQTSIGYGTRARPGETSISPEEATVRLEQELAKAATSVDAFATALPKGVRDALVSLTFNAGSGWQGAGLGAAIKAGDYSTAKEKFLQYNQAGGAVNQGLVNRRQFEASWFDRPPISDTEKSRLEGVKAETDKKVDSVQELGLKNISEVFDKFQQQKLKEISIALAQASEHATPATVENARQTVDKALNELVAKRTEEFEEKSKNVAANETGQALVQKQDELKKQLDQDLQKLADERQKALDRLTESARQASERAANLPIKELELKQQQIARGQSEGRLPESRGIANENALSVQKEVSARQLLSSALQEQKLAVDEVTRIQQTVGKGSADWEQANRRATQAEQRVTDARDKLAAATQQSTAKAQEFFSSGVKGYLAQEGVTDKTGKSFDFLTQLAKDTPKVLSSISSNFSNFFTQFLTGTLKGRDAWRKMLTGILTDLTKMLSQKAFSNFLGIAFPGLAGAAAPGAVGAPLSLAPPGASLGGFVHKALGGYISRMANGGLARDSVPAMLMPGEFVLRQSAVSVLGREQLDQWNNQGNRIQSQGNDIRPPETPSQPPTPFNVWLTQPNQIPPPGPRDFVHAIGQDILRNGATKTLIRQVAVGAI